VEYRIIWPDGSIHHILAETGDAIFDEAGNPVILTGTCQDITERKQAEESLRETNSYLENLINYANAPIIVWDPQFRITRFNHAFESITGRSEAQVVGQLLEILFPPALSENSMKLIRNTLTGERWETVEIEILHRDGSTRTVLWNSATLFAADGLTPIATIAQGQDITERKGVEMLLRESEEKYRILFRDSPDAYLIFADGVFTDCNPATEGMLRCDRTRIIGLSPQALSPEFQPDGRKSSEAAEEKIKEALQRGKGKFEWIHRRLDGSDFTVDVSTAAIMLDGKQALFIAWRDISERKQLEEDLKQLATKDDLTGITNRRHFLELASREVTRSIRLKHALALAVIDIDHFKPVNDTYGHAAGDHVIRNFTSVCEKHIREIDIFARFGGDEFILLLPETTSKQAYEVMERIRKTLLSQPIELEGKRVSITISSGISSLTSAEESLDQLLKRADQALYQAKETGRNRVVVE